MSKQEIRLEIKRLKKCLADLRAKCEKCDRWECGYCGVPKWNLEEKIEKLKEALA